MRTKQVAASKQVVLQYRHITGDACGAYFSGVDRIVCDNFVMAHLGKLPKSIILRLSTARGKGLTGVTYYVCDRRVVFRGGRSRAVFNGMNNLILSLIGWDAPDTNKIYFALGIEGTKTDPTYYPKAQTHYLPI